MELDKLHVEIALKEDVINKLRSKINKVEKQLEILNRRASLLSLADQLKKGSTICVLLDSDEDKYLSEEKNKGNLLVEKSYGSIVCDLRSKYSVSKDCGVEEVGWELTEDFVIYDAEGKEIDVLEIDTDELFHKIDKIAKDDGLECDGKPDYDGDHHGMWAYGKQTWDITIYNAKKESKSNSESNPEFS